MNPTLNVVEVIRRKRDGHALSAADICGFVAAYSADRIPDYQAAALLMAIFLRGLSAEELDALTDAMLRSGEVIDLSELPGIKVDKHSTGGVGDKVSLPLAPAVAACGVRVPMMSGRALGHTGGTLDKLESIPGFCTRLNPDEFRTVLRHTNLSLIGQTETLVPADRRLYALRDVTGTVESIPLISASIMSKKLAEGIDALVLDVKVGSGAFMKTLPQARALAETLVSIGRRAGKRVTAFLTDMDQPLGRWVGNAAEVHESLDILRGGGPPDLVELTLVLGAEMLVLGGAARDTEEGRRRIREVLSNGEAYGRLVRCATLQGARLDLKDADEVAAWRRDSVYPMAEAAAVPAPRDGVVVSIDAEAVGRAGVLLHIGRQRKEDAIDAAAYIYLDRKRGEAVRAGEPLCRFAASPTLAEGRRQEAEALLRGAFRVGDAAESEPPLVIDVLREEP